MVATLSAPAISCLILYFASYICFLFIHPILPLVSPFLFMFLSLSLSIPPELPSFSLVKWWSCVPPQCSFLHLTSPPSLSSLPSPEGKQPAPLSSFELYKEKRNCSHFPPRTVRLYGPFLPEGGPCCVCACVCVCACLRSGSDHGNLLIIFPHLAAANTRAEMIVVFFCGLYLWQWFI